MKLQIPWARVEPGSMCWLRSEAAGDCPGWGLCPRAAPGRLPSLLACCLLADHQSCLAVPSSGFWHTWPRCQVLSYLWPSALTAAPPPRTLPSADFRERRKFLPHPVSPGADFVAAVQVWQGAGIRGVEGAGTQGCLCSQVGVPECPWTKWLSGFPGSSCPLAPRECFLGNQIP